MSKRIALKERFCSRVLNKLLSLFKRANIFWLLLVHVLSGHNSGGCVNHAGASGPLIRFAAVPRYPHGMGVLHDQGIHLPRSPTFPETTVESNATTCVRLPVQSPWMAQPTPRLVHSLKVTTTLILNPTKASLLFPLWHLPPWWKGH